MRRRSLAFVLLAIGSLAAVAGCGRMRSAPAPDAAQMIVAERLPVTATRSSPHVLELRRIFADSVEARMLRTAESVVPPRAAVLAEFMGDDTVRAFARSAPRLWWGGTFDGVRLPYAITADAVRYYVALSDAFRRADFSGSNGISMSKSRFQYNARVERVAEFEHEGRLLRDVYVVRMVLSWSSVCGSLCGLWVEKERVVVLKSSGGVLAVFGDGEPIATVS